MDLPTLVEDVLRGAITPVTAPAEADYFAAWLDYDAGAHDPAITAVLGGALADRLAWVFVAGYQGTIRRCFPGLPPERGWCSFVNTEDRSGSLPGTSLTGEPGKRRLSGWKTWVATSDHVERLLVSARQGETPFILMRRDQPGIRIETGPARGYLSEMAQGRVEFVDVAVREEQLLGDDRTFPTFRRAECVHLQPELPAGRAAGPDRRGAGWPVGRRCCSPAVASLGPRRGGDAGVRCAHARARRRVRTLYRNGGHCPLRAVDEGPPAGGGSGTGYRGAGRSGAGGRLAASDVKMR